MTNNPQQPPAGPGSREPEDVEALREELHKVQAEKAILEMQLREYSEKLDQKVRERTRELEVINRIATTVSRSLNLEVILREALSKVLALLELDVGGVYLAEEGTSKMRLMAHQGLPHDIVVKMGVVDVGEGCVGRVALNGEPVLEIAGRDGEPRDEVLAAHPELKSHVGIPLESKGEVRGVMCLFSFEEDRFAPEDIKLLVAIGSEIGVAIENAWLYEKSYQHSKKMEELSVTDSLTGLHNRRHFYRRLKEEMARARRQGNPMSLLVVDLDNLKRFNDEKGHLKGDEALKGVARAITACIRQDVDSGYRYGGDEFAVILPYSDEERAAAVAERIRKTFEDFGFPDTGLSIGLTELVPGEDVDELVSRADTAMYIAKNAGGNKVEIASAKNGEDQPRDDAG